MRNSDNRYHFDCVQQYEHDKYLVKVTGKFQEIGGQFNEYVYNSFLCLKFIPRGLNVIQYMASKNSNISENLNCGTEDLDYVEQLLIADKFRELPDCPRDLRGAYKIVRIQDAVHNVTCNLRPHKTSLLESDCVDKEGIRMDFGAFNDCEGFNNDTNGVKYMRDVLYLRCYSVSWVENGWNYVVVKRNKATRKISYTNKEMFYCMRFRKDPITTKH